MVPVAIAFLRAINVGGRTVKMERLRELFTELGLREVETFIASGNVIFRHDDEPPAEIEAHIEAQLLAGLGYAVETFVRTGEELRAVVAFDPFPGEATEGATLSVSFLRGAPSPEEAAAVEALSTPTDLFRVHGREFYWLCRTRVSDSTVTGKMFGQALKGPSTMRNLTTVRRLVAKYCGDKG